MAVDTRPRRATTAALLLPFLPYLPLPDGGVEAQDRAALAHVYAGFVEEDLTPGGIAPTILSLSLADGQINRPYSRALLVTGDTPYTFSVSTGSLPTGLTLNTSTGVISGTPTVLGDETFEITVENDEGDDTREFTIDIVAAAGLPALSNAGVGGAGVSRLFGVGTSEVSGP